MGDGVKNVWVICLIVIFKNGEELRGKRMFYVWVVEYF